MTTVVSLGDTENIIDVREPTVGCRTEFRYCRHLNGIQREHVHRGQCHAIDTNNFHVTKAFVAYE